ncbi:Cof-type HAD-IIB family hydrolase [Weissella diestrammenae]|uniref:Cof-type HAD-IIB family hydrolase n=1 Tax=Weissella diestrammenae TaxID=1162633 RepID=A0A7G9T556_9LACO|nr:Cof-type HAD-IIB family hydrolase [Weissella diestrammenae]MCM0583087.1 Cof-type HAD-IIB family hydrolase [Weissella diestrammenae]QNN75231.1 Cof-type HAD-IIB family hydrolase [Weissella diestrammenae]
MINDIKLIATDLDGTFFDDERHVNFDKFDWVLEQLANQQQRFVIATGNDKPKVDAFFSRFKGRFDYVVNNGAQVVTQNQTQIGLAALKQAQLTQLTNFLKQQQFQWEQGLIFNGLSQTYMLEDDRDIGHLQAETAWYYPNLTYIAALENIPATEQIIKVTFSLMTKQVPELIEKINQEFGDDLHVTTSGHGSIDIMLGGANKANGLQLLLNHYALNASQLMVFGDGLNDLEMMQLAEFPHAMPNGDAYLLERFPKASASNNDDGVLDTIINKLELK